MKTLIDGFLRFKQQIYPERSRYFRELANGQKPEALFITCSDSRVLPNLITQSGPGDLFICRTVGNQVPPAGTTNDDGVSSAIEYAVQVLDVPNIIVCGHSDCGAMKALLNPQTLPSLPATSAWLRHSEALADLAIAYNGNAESNLLALTERNILAQLEHLRTHSSVAEKCQLGTLHLHGWNYNIATGDITAFDSTLNRFVALESMAAVDGTLAQGAKTQFVGAA
jgi:carbonic anhydrase